MDKTKKPKKYRIKKFFRELKRVRWPSNKTNWISFWKVIIFATLFTIIVVLFATCVGLLWSRIGIK
ncbi:Hypothetical protein MBVG_4280 [Mycoplasmopsis bovigenitalium 51080]|uniref:Preprotein translocase subunit SecE n=1 Tax=Mycoplasmopsis bovigenitalium 51080 TaxID=1188235 RepID=N9TTK2_9BACT|nr:Hypothetical protein MBVG_4280 [Mycoplasmopsis bovigenitalium 51080]